MASQLCESVCLHGPEPLVSWDMPETGQGLLSAWWCLFVCLFYFGPVLSNFSLSPSVIQNVNTLTTVGLNTMTGQWALIVSFSLLNSHLLHYVSIKLLTVKPQNNMFKRGNAHDLLRFSAGSRVWIGFLFIFFPTKGNNLPRHSVTFTFT